MLGLQDPWQTSTCRPPQIVRTGILKDEGFRIEKLYYESMPDLFEFKIYIIPGNITPYADIKIARLSFRAAIA